MLNPETNKFEMLEMIKKDGGKLARAIDGRLYEQLTREMAPKSVPIFRIGEERVIKGYIFRVVEIKEKRLVFEPVGPDVGNSANRAKRKRRKGKKR
jgi:hypothetical protein